MRKEKLIIILLALAMCTIVGKETYAYYISNMKVNIISTSSEVICDAEITEVPNAEKTKLGYSEFKVIVKNHDSSNNITKEPFNYTLNIENNGTTNGVDSSEEEYVTAPVPGGSFRIDVDFKLKATQVRD